MCFIYIHTGAHTQHTRTYIHTHMYMYTHTETHTPAHTGTHTYTYKHTHTHCTDFQVSPFLTHPTSLPRLHSAELRLVKPRVSFAHGIPTRLFWVAPWRRLAGWPGWDLLPAICPCSRVTPRHPQSAAVSRFCRMPGLSSWSLSESPASASSLFAGVSCWALFWDLWHSD